jgi:MarR family transcriptional regulator, organic hydroperoxide resistance regulator
MGLKDGSRTDPGDHSKDYQKQKPAASDRRLADFLCFAIYSANLAYGRGYKQGLEELSLTYPQWIPIVALWEQDDQTVSELGDNMFLESNTLTPILKKLRWRRALRPAGKARA